MKPAILKTIGDYKDILKSTWNSGPSMRLRLFVFFLGFLVAVMSGVFMILLASGVFQTGKVASYNLLKHELDNISNHIRKDYGDISVQGPALSQKLTESLEKQFNEFGFSAGELQDHPELLPVLLETSMPTLTDYLEKTRSSGVFLILDATVNPALEEAEFYRAGLFIKNMEPNIVNSSFSTLRLLRGPMTAARRHGMQILPQWKMEFYVKDMDWFRNTLDQARNSSLPLSRLYYWSHSMRLADNIEPGMLCCVPLRDSKGTVFGICGFEVSSMLFKLSYSPDNSVYNHIFCMFSPLEDNNLYPGSSLFAGNYAAHPFNISEKPLSMDQVKHSFNYYSQPDYGAYAGLQQSISLYPKDSVFEGDEWCLALLMPARELLEKVSSGNSRLLILLALLMAASIVVSSVISRIYIRPVIEGLNMIKTTELSTAPKTRIPEIDDLIEFLAAQDDAPGNETGKTQGEHHEFSLFREFVKNIDTLSTAERAVFDLYLKGHTAKEIADILCLSINTIKTHNKRIYMKLNVSSRKELMVYVQMMEEANSRGAAKE